MTNLYFKLTDEQRKEGGYPENTWIAVVGEPPKLEAFSSTHIFSWECPYSEVRLRLSELSGNTNHN